MQLSGLLDLLRDHPAYRAVLHNLRRDRRGGDLGVLRSARSFVLSALARDWHAPVVYVTARVDRAYNVAEQLPAWLGDAPVYRFAEPTPRFYERAPWGDTVIQNRIETLAALMPPDESQITHPPVIVTSARAIMRPTMPVNQFRQHGMVLRVGQQWHINKLLQHWLSVGYEPTALVVEAGTFSQRGGIVDVFPVVGDNPIRIEFFDDEIDSLRHFDPATQRSFDTVDQVFVPPAREALPVHTPALADHLHDWFENLPPASEDVISPQEDLKALATGTGFPYIEYYLPYLYRVPVSLLDYAAQDALIVIEDWDELAATITDIETSAVETRAEREADGYLPPNYPRPYLGWNDLHDALDDRYTVHLGGSPVDQAQTLRSIFGAESRFGGQLKPMLTEVRTLRNQGDRVLVVSKQAERLAELWQEQESGFAPRTDKVMQAPARQTMLFVDGALQEGWRLRTGDGETHLLTDAEIFGWSRPEPRRRKAKQRSKAPQLNYADLREGDYVVHVDYGVGRFSGMRRRTLEDVEREYLILEYAGTDTLFVPIHQADRLTRYVGPDDKPPTLNKLGQPDWLKVKTKAKKAAEEEARELLDLYAARASTQGHAFQFDSHWQHELEASFPFVETEDQLRAVSEVKRDMEQPHPMDRLICGDVGFGKTEVALRAAFKAVMDGKQVAVLVPTTILAQQHYETFSRRLAAFPIKVESLSRFRTKAQQNTIIPSVASGDVDILVGTHRILSDDVTFKDLGLVIIDEEQRFGVKHKEHFKRLRTQVDVLTLTATPIPRTLYMGLTGVRDISMIQTPPEERLPIITHVGAFDERLVRQAVLRELERGGQIFVVHNRVQSIDRLRDRLEQIVPEARIVVGHGQMNERQLEKVITHFALGDYDILLATSIIENGIDIPTANTLIVDRADWFGVSQLYQLRGRVGRSAQQAYAYFFHPGVNRLSQEAWARLETLREYTDLGAGYQIAMRDLELRGAGDILSTRQTGHVAAIGLNLYTKMLANTVKTMKGEQPDDSTAVSDTSIIIDLPLPAYLPTDWIPDMSQRLQIYQRIGGLDTSDDVEQMRAELSDRFGELPRAVVGLLYQMDVKLLAHAAHATGILARDGLISIRLPYLPEIDRPRLEARLGDGVRVTRTAVEIAQDSEGTWQEQLLDILARLAHNIASETTANDVLTGTGL